MDTPWRMFSQVIRLCGRPHIQRSVTSPSYKSTQTGTQSAQRVFGLTNWNKQMIYFSRLLHNLGETSLMDRGKKTTDSAPRLQCYNIDTRQEIKYAHLHFKFIQKQNQQLIVVSLNCHQSTPSKAYHIVHTHPCVYFKCIYTYAQTHFWLTFASWCTSNISVPNTRVCKRAAGAADITHSMYNNIHNIHKHSS